MLALMPVFLEREDFWRRDSFAVLASILRHFVSSGGVKRYVVVTDLPEVADHCRDLACSVHLLDDGLSSTPHEGWIVPRGSEAAWRVCRRYHAPATDTLLLDFRNPSLDAATIARAIKAYHRRRPKLLYSIKECRLHPCQLYWHLKTSAAGTIHRFDPTPPPFSGIGGLDDGVRLSRPFPFDWKSKEMDRATAGDLFRPMVEGESIRYRRIDRGVDRNGLVYDGPDRARIACATSDLKRFLAGIHREKGPCECLGASLTPDYVSIHTLLLRYADRYLLVLPCNRSVGGNPLLSCLAVFGDHASSRDILVHGSVDGDVMFFDLGQMPPDLVGLAFCCLSETIQGSYDLRIPYTPAHDLWRIDALFGRHVNTKTKRKIRGRQDFPEVFEPDGSLAITTLDDVPRIPEILRQGHGKGFLLDASEARRVATPLDFLRLSIALKREERVEYACA